MDEHKRRGPRPKHESGAGRKLNIYLSPWHEELLDRMVCDKLPSRSAVVARLLERAQPAKAPEKPEARPVQSFLKGRP